MGAPVDQDAPADLIPSEDFRLAMRKVTSPVAVITVRAGDKRNGLTATAVCSATTDPPTLLVCINRGATCEGLIAKSGSFAVNFLTEEQAGIARLFSTARLDPAERFAEGRWTAGPSGAPMLADTVASFDCRVVQMVPCGTHSIFMGQVVGVTGSDGPMLLYRDGYFRRLSTD